MTRTKSKLGTDKKLKSISRRKPRKGSYSTTTSLWNYPYELYHEPTDYSLIKFLLWGSIFTLIIWIIWRLYG